MATASASRNAFAPRSNATATPAIRTVEKKILTPEKIALFAGAAVAMILFGIAAMNAAGSLSTPLAAGEAPGVNPALDFGVLGLIALLGPYGFLQTRALVRIEKIEERLPDFLRDVAEAGRFGMTLPDAIIVASKGRYGPLTEEIKKMASQLEWGVPVAEALRLFEQRVPTPLVSRVVSVITRANEAGGNVADVLTMVAHNARENQLSQAARKITMLTYVTVIYISFFVFLFVILVLAADFLPAMVQAGQKVSESSSLNAGGGAVSLQFQFVPVLFLAFLVAVVAHAVGDGVMAGVLYNGRIADGLRHATIMLVVGWAVMRFLVPPVG
jgi:flagellar protein FlaJ